jgi:hypothetical protein
MVFFQRAGRSPAISFAQRRWARRWILVPAGAAMLAACGSDPVASERASRNTAALGGGNCFGAVGPNCDGVPVLAPCDFNAATNTYLCQVSVGSQMHDSCCGRFPNGFNCGSPFVPIATCPPGTPHCCEEWAHAQSDTVNGRQFSARFKGDQTAIAGPLAQVNDSTFDPPTPFAYLVPGGTRVLMTDAQLGWCKFGWDAAGAGEAICRNGPSSSPNPCVSAPSHAAFCGSDTRYGFTAQAVSSQPNTLFHCDHFGVDNTVACPNGCALGNGPADDFCSPQPPPPQLHCPTDGFYCGNDGVGGDANTLYQCTGGVADIAIICPNGCQSNPPGVNDQCIDLRCPTNGLYCGNDGVGGDPGTLYKCVSGVATISQVCTNGCQTNPAGINDQCGSSSGLHCPTDGFYCGSDGVGGDPNTLYLCTGGVAAVSQVCPNGCQTNPQGVSDVCAGLHCPTDGLYCGTDGVGGDQDTLYQCSGGVATAVQRCPNGCQTNPPGVNDQCAPNGLNCPTNGFYCGSDGVGGDQNTLYRCTGGVADIAIICPNGCQTNPPGQNDQCVGLTCPTDGLYCGNDGVGGDPTTLYQCITGVATVSQVCSKGCQSNPPGQNDQCL